MLKTKEPEVKKYNIKINIPKSWKSAAGLLSKKRKSLESHLKKIRSEWE